MVGAVYSRWASRLTCLSAEEWSSCQAPVGKYGMTESDDFNRHGFKVNRLKTGQLKGSNHYQTSLLRFHLAVELARG